MTQREVLSINVGEAGINFGNSVWQQYCVEHNIDKDGNINNKSNDCYFLKFFKETASGQYTPRNLMVDLEANIINNIKCSKYCNIYTPLYLLSGKKDAANNFARGHYSVGKEMIEKINDRLRLLVDDCNNVQGFVINHSVGGGTGSGLGALILDSIAVDYRKKSKLGFEIFPFNNNQSQCVVEPYNAILTTHWLLDHTEISLLFDNRKLYQICKDHLKIPTPTYADMNNVISKIESSLTYSLRFEVPLNLDLNELQGGSFCPFPRLHFFTTSIAPIIGDKNIKHVPITQKWSKSLIDGFVRQNYNYPNNVNCNLLQWEPPLYSDLMELLYKIYSDKYIDYQKKYYDIESVYDLMEMCCDPDYFMIECKDYDVDTDKCMLIWVNFHGDIQAKQANAYVQKLKNKKRTTFVEWCPTGFKVGLNEHVAPTVDTDKLISKDKSVSMIMNNTLVGRYFEERVANKYDLMYAQRAYVHWYVAEGMEEGEFAEAREDIGFLHKDYMDVLSEQPTDDYDYDD